LALALELVLVLVSDRTRKMHDHRNKAGQKDKVDPECNTQPRMVGRADKQISATALVRAQAHALVLLHSHSSCQLPCCNKACHLDKQVVTAYHLADNRLCSCCCIHGRFPARHCQTLDCPARSKIVRQLPCVQGLGKGPCLLFGVARNLQQQYKRKVPIRSWSPSVVLLSNRALASSFCCHIAMALLDTRRS